MNFLREYFLLNLLQMIYGGTNDRLICFNKGIRLFNLICYCKPGFFGNRCEFHVTSFGCGINKTNKSVAMKHGESRQFQCMLCGCKFGLLFCIRTNSQCYMNTLKPTKLVNLIKKEIRYYTTRSSSRQDVFKRRMFKRIAEDTSYYDRLYWKSMFELQRFNSAKIVESSSSQTDNNSGSEGTVNYCHLILTFIFIQHVLSFS
ncbi:hypothetical protein SNEBB_008044 [Seison nebaliae]|nr:hypothetical protein SNEBB_008044 [Seison nebaliae]